VTNPRERFDAALKKIAAHKPLKDGEDGTPKAKASDGRSLRDVGTVQAWAARVAPSGPNVG
jgi:hypothetical protein